MTISKQNALIMAMFLIPVVCCFIGIGAFIHVTVAAEKVEQQKDVELWKQKLQELAELRRQLNALEEAAGDLQQKIAEVEERILELAERLKQLSEDGETAQVLEGEIHGLKELLARLLVELSALRDQIAKKQKEIDTLKNETKEAGSLDEQLKKLQKKKEELEKQRDKAKSKHDGLVDRIAKLRRWREEEEDKFELRPLKPRPLGVPDPVFAECTAGGVIIQPEGTRLSANPQADDRSRFLAAARRTGYVVFLVRPGGVYSFKEYRDLLKNESSGRSIRFGFEPVDASWELIYPGQGD